MGKFQDLSGHKFGKLTVIKKVPNNNPKEKHAMWLCQCECGNKKKVLSIHLKNGSVKSCGCLNHGKSNTRLYGIWAKMKDRCNNDKSTNYEYYGGRGISICDEWLHDFQAFYDWAMANGYKDDLTIDRINNNGNYEPSNCHWTNRKIQQNNRRNNIIISFNGKSQTLSQWATELNVKQNTLLYRLNRGWSIEKAFTTDVQRHNSRGYK